MFVEDMVEGSTYLQHYIQCFHQGFLQIFRSQRAALIFSSNIFKAFEGPDSWEQFQRSVCDVETQKLHPREFLD